MIVVLAGRRPDPPDTDVQRFPIANAVAVRERIRSVLSREQPRVLVSSAACGADLLAQDVAGELGIKTFIVLPFDAKQFRNTSVVDRPGHWGELYDRIITGAKSSNRLVILDEDNGAERSYKRANEEILALSERKIRSGESRAALIVWEGTPKESGDFTRHLRQRIQEEGGDAYEVQTVFSE